MALSPFKSRRARQIKAALASAENPLNAPRCMAMLVDCGAYTFAVDPRDKFVGGALLEHGEYEVDELDRVTSAIDSETRVLFVGSHIGAFAIPVAKRCKEIAIVEANPDSFRLLKINCTLNYVHNATLYPFAAGEAEGQIRFVKNTFNSGGSKREPLEPLAFYYDDNPEVVDVPMRRLDDALAGQKFDVMVMDIEGSEVFALRGMPQILAGLRALFLEFVPHHLRSVAGVSVAEFVDPLLAHFDQMVIPSQNRTLGRDDIADALQEMFLADQMENTLIFSKSAAPVS